MNAKQIVAFDHVRIAFSDQLSQSLKRVFLGFVTVVWIDNNQFFPVGVVGKRDAHDVFVIGENFELHSFQLCE